MRLQNLTGQESGVVVYPDGNSAIVCNWSGQEGLPSVFAGQLIWIFMSTDAADLDLKPEYVASIAEICGDCEILYNANGDELVGPGRVYRLEHVIIIAPDDWC